MIERRIFGQYKHTFLAVEGKTQSAKNCLPEQTPPPRRSATAKINSCKASTAVVAPSPLTRTNICNVRASK